MIGIIGAMDLEIKNLRTKLTDAQVEKISGVEFVSGQLCGQDVVLAVCGVGKCFAALAAEAMILRYKPSVIINIGVAGTLIDRLNIGDMAIGNFAVCHDMDTSPLGDPVGMISGINLVQIPLDAVLAAKLKEICREENINAVEGVIASGDQFICDPQKKRWIADTFFAIACEMEGQAIAQVSYVNGVPCAILRSISDGADGNAMDYEQFKSLAAEHSSGVILRFLSALEK